MVNSQMIKEVVDAFKLDLNTEIIPTVIPVCEVNPKFTKMGISRSQSLTNATANTIYTTPATQDFYLTGGCLSFVRDATATSTLFNIQYYDEHGQTQNLLTFAGVTLTAGSGAAATPLFNPIKVQRGTIISINSSTNTGNFKVTAQVYGYIDEVR